MSKVQTVLLTGFGPFGGDTTNPSWDAVRQLHGKQIAGAKVIARELPVEFGTSVKRLRQLIREHKPTAVICIGQAGGRTGISLERIAINVDDARIADNAGNKPVDCPIEPDGPAAYFTGLPIKTMLHDLLKHGVPASVSQSAGTYVCNHVFYGLMHAVRTQKRIKAGFIHIPFSPAQACLHKDAPSLSVDEVVRALRIIVRAAVTAEQDIELAGGAEH